MTVYADTSFLVSLYAPDSNSAEAARRMQRSKAVVLFTQLGELELTNALELRRFRKELTDAEVKAAHAALRKDIEDNIFVVRSLPESVFHRARRLSVARTAQLGTRSLDLLHVAAALEFDCDWFYTFDNSQRKLAHAEGLKTL